MMVKSCFVNAGTSSIPLPTIIILKRKSLLISKRVDNVDAAQASDRWLDRRKKQQNISLALF